MMPPVIRSADFRRVESLPRRTVSPHDFDILAVTNLLRTHDGEMELRAIQAMALREIQENEGLLGAIGVGHGKTLVSLLAPSMVQAERPLLLLPAQLKRLTIESVLPEMKRHWKISPALRIESYHELSNNRNLLEEYEPDLIIADECHRISRKESARTRRIMRYFNTHPETKFVGLSGTVTRKSLEDYWHLALMALGEKAPLPLKWREMKVWASALDDGIIEPERASLGALRRFCEDPSPQNTGMRKERERVREGYRRRLTETPGVLATSDTGCEASLVIRKRFSIAKPAGSPLWMVGALDTLRNNWTTPAGEEITDAVDYWRKAREIGMGFYYEWDWETPNLEWLRARSEWRKFVRRTTQRRPQFDTEMLVTLACERGELRSSEYDNWILIKGDENPKTRTVWCCDRVLEDAMSLVTLGDPGNKDQHRDTIIWYEQRAVGERLKELRPEWPLFKGGPQATQHLAAHVRDVGGPCIASIRAHGIGVNLQAFNDGIILTPPSSGAIWEQLLGRTHRAGQEADEVIMTVYQHTKEFEGALEKALENAKYIEQSTGQTQKLNYASIA